MNIALALAIATATLNLATAIAHYAISRAPGWRVARAFSLIALAAALYSCGNVVMGIEGLPGKFYVSAVRWNYVWAHVHVLAWLPFAFGGPDASFRAMPAAVRRLVWANAPIAMLFALTGWHLTGQLYDLPISWAHVVYRYAVTTRIGDLYGIVLVGTLCVTYLHLWIRMVRGEHRLWLLVMGFTVFLGCAVIVLLVAIRTLSMFSPDAAPVHRGCAPAPGALRTPGARGARGHRAARPGAHGAARGRASRRAGAARGRRGARDQQSAHLRAALARPCGRPPGRRGRPVRGAPVARRRA